MRRGWIPCGGRGWWCVQEEGVVKGGHGLDVEVEEVGEGEGVVAGVLFEERGEVGTGCGAGAEDEESGYEGGDGADGEEDDGDSLAGSSEGVGDGEGFGFGGFGVEP